MHLELSSRSSKSNIDTVGTSYMFYMEMANHVLRAGAVRMAVGVVLVSFWAFIGHLTGQAASYLLARKVKSGYAHFIYFIRECTYLVHTYRYCR